MHEGYIDKAIVIYPKEMFANQHGWVKGAAQIQSMQTRVFLDQVLRLGREVCGCSRRYHVGDNGSKGGGKVLRSPEICTRPIPGRN